MTGYLCKSLRIISLVWPTRLIFLAIGEVLSFGFNLVVSFPSDSRGSKARIVLLPSRITRWGLFHIHYRNQLLCRPPRRTAKALTADGKGLCRQPRTAKGSGNVDYGKRVLCRLPLSAKSLPSAADGKKREADGKDG